MLDTLRQRAEEIAKANEAKLDRIISPAETRLALHELQVHQIELEMQNEELRNTQRELEILRAKYFDLYDLAPVGYVTLNDKGLILEANLTFATMLSVPRKFLVNKPITRFLLKEDQDVYHRYFKELLGTCKLQACELRIVPQGSAPSWVKIEAISAQDMSGAGVYHVAINDITERKKIEKELYEAETLQRAIFNSANFSSIATDAKGVIQIFNIGAEHMLGYSAADVLNKFTPADISDPKEVVARAKELSRELETPIAPGFEALVFKASRGIEDIYELTYIRKDGSSFPAVVSVTALRDEHSAILGYLLIGTDNTDRKRAEKALLEAGALQRAIFNSVNFSSIATDAKGVIQIFNVGAERMLGYSAAEVLNKFTPADISDPKEVVARAKELSMELETPIAPGFEALVFKASRGIEDVYELTYIRKDGSRFPAVVSITALRDDQNAIIGYLLIGTDNTAHKRLEDSKRRLEQLKEDVEIITKHDLKSPLSGIINIPMLLLEDNNLTQDQRYLLNLLELSGHKMLQQINSTLELYKIETNAYCLVSNDVDPVKLVRDDIAILARGLQFDLARITLQVQSAKVDDNCISIKTDGLLLDIIFMNLLRNALEFSDTGAQVIVDLSHDADKFTISISNCRPVPVEIRERFFEKYVTAGKRGGTGLGTYSAAVMTRALGGTIEMETSDEIGTRVTVCFKGL